MGAVATVVYEDRARELAISVLVISAGAAVLNPELKALAFVAMVVAARSALGRSPPSCFLADVFM